MVFGGRELAEVVLLGGARCVGLSDRQSARDWHIGVVVLLAPEHGQRHRAAGGRVGVVHLVGAGDNRVLGQDPAGFDRAGVDAPVRVGRQQRPEAELAADLGLAQQEVGQDPDQPVTEVRGDVELAITPEPDRFGKPCRGDQAGNVNHPVRHAARSLQGPEHQVGHVVAAAHGGVEQPAPLHDHAAAQEDVPAEAPVVGPAGKRGPGLERAQALIPAASAGESREGRHGVASSRDREVPGGPGSGPLVVVLGKGANPALTQSHVAPLNIREPALPDHHVVAAAHRGGGVLESGLGRSGENQHPAYGAPPAPPDHRDGLANDHGRLRHLERRVAGSGSGSGRRREVAGLGGGGFGGEGCSGDFGGEGCSGDFCANCRR